LYVADTDNGIVGVIDTKSNAKIAEITVGARPVRVLVGSDDTIYVANRGDNSVSVIRRGSWAEAARLQVGVEPTGLAVSGDGKQLLVVSSAAIDNPDYGTLTSFDTATLTPKFEIPVGAEPRAVTVVSGNRAVVSLFKQGELVEVDLSKGTLKGGTGASGIYDKANASRSTFDPSYGGGFSTFHPRAIADLIVTPDGNRVFAPLVWAREDAIGRKPSTAGGYYSAGGPCNVGAVATAGIVTVDTHGSLTPQVDDLTGCFSTGVNAGNDKDYPASTLASSSPGSGDAIQGPTVGVVDPTGTWLFVVNRESSNVAVLPAFRRTGDDTTYASTGTSVRSLVHIGAGADGIALTRDGTKAYVYSQFDHAVETLESSGHGSSAQVVNTGTAIAVAQDVLSPDLAAGRRLFFDALDTRMSSALTNVACATCHLEGREDGHVWEFPDGPRQTPALAGRHVLSTAPYHWSGEFTDIGTFNKHTITERMGGSGLTTAAAAQLDGYIDQLPAAATGMNAASEAVTRGKALFEGSAACATCHTGALLTNNGFAEVGTLNTHDKNADKGPVASAGFNVPSLLGLGRSAPYLHDGSLTTLEERIFKNDGDVHGKTSELTADQKLDLVSYLKSL
jgi:YVTN family beta-propeller protein